ncbi:ATP-dependent RNA helicase HrpA [Leucobacter sp. OH1287]|uniref:ATP-dependent RNA helicase HrpA n=1 Tax=Leucobacter sp. OH1287 TaxID=2491049 RepID=UPI000F5F9951|nr:ATP-dependent RNA helicase HrpA [Leucobacter sp. OH1287]RRD60672.1 ATP-dependent RNA helicase HrpA [Leucobacter sp. OH1287]
MSAENNQSAQPLSEISFNPGLPVSKQRDEIAEAIKNNQVVIVAGETGSGKTTQLPKIALTLGRRKIAHTQPRRIAARSVAERIAEELGTKVGERVGYQVRFTDRVSESTEIRLMTDGILLNAIHRDRLLRQYDTIIIDEAHERSLNIDFLLGYLRTILPKRPDLRVIITSATINPEAFSEHFHGAPIITVSGRTYPVEVRYRPLDTAAGEDLYDGITAALTELKADTSGDMLVFLSGEGEIRDAAEAISGRFNPASFEVLPLYGRLSAADQHRVFAPVASGKRRIVLATNVAETSITVPGITAVVDAGTARISRYSSRSKVQRLPIEAISKASATQRSGRAGRLSPGVAIRLYSEEDFNARPEFTDPEILRTGLAAVLLQMYSLGLGAVKKFPFLTPPDAKGVRDGVALLEEIGAVSGGKITRTGRAIARLPLEPRYSRMVLEGAKQGIAPEIIALTAGLTIPDVREYPTEQREQAKQSHSRFNDPQGDLITLLNLWNYLNEQQRELSGSAFRRLLKREFLNVLRVREWLDLNRQLTRALQEVPEREKTGSAAKLVSGKYELIHFCVLSGLLSHIGLRDDVGSPKPGGSQKGGSTKQRAYGQPREYIGARGRRFVLHPSSVLKGKNPEAVMSVELVETSRLFGRLNAQLRPEWAEQLAPQLLRRSYSDPHWQASRGQASGYERVLLYGVPIVEKRRVSLAKYDATLARQLFIRHALVNGEWAESHSFMRHNQQLRKQLEQLEERTRQRGLVGDEETLCEFYDERIPKQVVTAQDFTAWWTKTVKQTPKLLNATKEDLLLQDTAAAESDSAEFPRVWSFGEQRLQLRYRFDPRADDDGVTVTVPLPLLQSLPEGSFESLVPGLRLELIAALIKTLPKPIRKHVVPANDWAKTLLASVQDELGDDAHTPEDTPLLRELLAKQIRRLAGVPVTAEDFAVERLPAHLRPNFRVVDGGGKTVGTGKDLGELQQRLKRVAETKTAAAYTSAVPKHTITQTGLTDWPVLDGGGSGGGADPAGLGPGGSGPGGSGPGGASLAEPGADVIPQQLRANYAQPKNRSQGSVRVYPALVDKRGSVDLQLLTDPLAQAATHRLGVRRLVALSSPPLQSYVREHLTQREKLLLGAGPYRGLDDVIADIALAVAEETVRELDADGLIWQRSEFAEACSRFQDRILDKTYQTIALVVTVLEELKTARQAIASVKSLAVLSQVADASAQLDALVWAPASGTGFIARTGLKQLARLPVYLRAVTHRMQQLQQQAGRDRVAMQEISTLTAAYQERGGSLPHSATADPQLTRVRWLLEELRVSLFAQQLGTAEKVSGQRIRKALTEV